MFWSCGSSTLKSNLLQILDQSSQEVAKLWTFEVQLIQKYLTNPEVSCLKSALKWSSSELQWKEVLQKNLKWNMNHQPSHKEVKTRDHLKKSSEKFTTIHLEVKVELVAGQLEVQDPLEVWSHHFPQVHLPRFGERRGKSGSVPSRGGTSSAVESSGIEVMHSMNFWTSLWSTLLQWKVPTEWSAHPGHCEGRSHSTSCSTFSKFHLEVHCALYQLQVEVPHRRRHRWDDLEVGLQVLVASALEVPSKLPTSWNIYNFSSSCRSWSCQGHVPRS